MPRRGRVISFLPPGIPRSRLMPALVLVMADSCMTACIQTTAGFMVLDFVTPDPNRVGFYTGIMCFSFYIMQALSSLIVGWASDYFGRRPVLLVGVIGSLVTSTCLCFTFNFWYMVFVKALNGLFYIYQGVLKAYMGDLSDSSNRPKLASLHGLLYRYPDKIDQHGFFAYFPYFIPNVFCAALCLLGLLLGYFFLEDKAVQTPQPIELQNLTSDFELSNDLDSELSKEFTSDSIKSEPLVRPSTVSLIKIYALPIVLCVIYAFTGLVTICFRTIVPVWAMADVDVGGLGFDSTQVGLMNAIGGVVVPIIHIIMYNPTVNKLKLLCTFRIGIILCAPAFILTPPLRRLVPLDTKAALWVAIAGLVFLQQFAMQYSLTPILTMITNSVSNNKMGKANGIGQCLGCIGEAVGPALLSPLLAWSFEGSRKMDSIFVFAILAGASLLIVVPTVKIPSTINFPMCNRALHSPTPPPSIAIGTIPNDSAAYDDKETSIFEDSLDNTTFPPSE
ncbi:transporter, major facilitator family protein [Pelomyxa schiedti]|nr:transporter, major facilitator family protein [Pelomyxa schiedti]